VLDLVTRADDIALTLTKRNVDMVNKAKVEGVKAWLDTWTKSKNSTHGPSGPPVSILVVSRMVSVLDAKHVGPLPENTRLLYSEAWISMSRLLHNVSGGSEQDGVMQSLKLQLEARLADEPAQAVRRNLATAMELVKQA